VAFQAVEKSLSVRETEKLVQKFKEKPPRAQKSLVDPDLKALEEELIQCLGTKVTITGQRNKGTTGFFISLWRSLTGSMTKLKELKHERKRKSQRNC